MGNDQAEQRKQEQTRIPMRNKLIAPQKPLRPQGTEAVGTKKVPKRLSSKHMNCLKVCKSVIFHPNLCSKCLPLVSLHRRMETYILKKVN